MTEKINFVGPEHEESNKAQENQTPNNATPMFSGNECALRFKIASQSRILGFGFKDWMKCSCPSCKKTFEFKDLMEFGIVFTPRFLGDLTFSYFCSNCSVCIVWHIKCDIKTLDDLVSVFSQDNAKFEGQYQHILIENHRHNVAEAEAKKS